MKVCLYSEGLGQMRSITESGITSAFKHLHEMLERSGVEVTNDIEDDFDILHMNLGIGPMSLAYARYFRSKGKKIVIHAHSTAEDFADSFRFSRPLMPVLRKTLPVFYQQADLILCPSEYTRRLLKSYGLKRPIIPISNGVDVKKFRHSEKKRLAFRKAEGIVRPLVFSVGHVFKRKGVNDFVGVAQALPQYKFYWFGKIYPRLAVSYTELKPTLEAKLPNLKFAGYTPDIIAAYSGGDIFFFPSYCENQGIAILEAAAMGKPVVARNLPTYKGWLFPGENCLQGEDNAEFARALRSLAEDKQLYLKLVQNGYTLAEKNSFENVGKELKGIYERLLRN